MNQSKPLFQQYYDSDIADSQEFYFVKAQKALSAWRALSIDELLLKDLLGVDYNLFNQKADSDETVKKIKDYATNKLIISSISCQATLTFINFFSIVHFEHE